MRVDGENYTLNILDTAGQVSRLTELQVVRHCQNFPYKGMSIGPLSLDITKLISFIVSHARVLDKDNMCVCLYTNVVGLITVWSC